MISAILLIFALPAGCVTDMPVSVDVTTAPPASAATPSPAQPATISPAATLAGATAALPAASGQPAAWRFPADAAVLFSPGGVPDDYASPLYVSGERRMLLYLTDGGNIRQAQWDGEGYHTLPVAENVDAGSMASAVVDEAGKRLFCAGARQYAGRASGPSIVMIDLEDGARCNIDEQAGFNETGRTVSSDFQYFEGRVLARLADTKGAKLNQWVVFDIAGKTYQALDLTNFKETSLPGWRELVSLNLTLAGDGLLAVCVAGGYSEPAATGADTAAKSPYECLAFPLDMKGAPAGAGVKIAGGERKTCCGLQDGLCFRASPDGRLLLYTGADKRLFVYDIEANMESTVYGGGAALSFAAWGSDGAVYYAAVSAKTAGGYLIYRADISETANN